jgi:hypothetical protein
VRIVAWNMEGSVVGDARATALLARIEAAAPDVAVLLDAPRAALSGWPGAALVDPGARWRGDKPDGCKVVVWSRTGWRDVRLWPELSALGGAVSGVVDADIGPVRILAVCTPYNMAWPEAAEQRPARWSLHVTYLAALKEAIASLDDDLPLVLVGEFNQSVPLAIGTWEAHHALSAVLKRLAVLTRGDLPGAAEAHTVHVATGSTFRARRVEAIDRRGPDGVAFADHPGVLVELEPGGLTLFD